MIGWILFNLRCLMLEQMGVCPDDEPSILPPHCWGWAERNAHESHHNRAWKNSYTVVNYYPRILANPFDPDNDIPF